MRSGTKTQTAGRGNATHRTIRHDATRATREQALAAAVSPQLSGYRASDWIRRWDKGTKSARSCLLEAFVRLHADSNSATVERDLGDAAPLFFTRVTSWLHLTYKTFMKKTATITATAASSPPPLAGGEATGGVGSVTPLLLIMKVLTVFVRGASYMTQLVESGLASTLTDCLACGSAPVGVNVVLDCPLKATSDGGFEPLPDEVLVTARASHPYALLSVEERKSIVVLLLFMANAGRVYREMICDEADSLVQLLHAMQREQDAGVAELLMELFSALSQGNPRMAPLIQTALVRVVLCHQYMDIGNTSDMQLKRTRTFLTHLDTSRLEVTQTAEVAMQAARALHAIQLQKETHYLSSSPGQEAADRMPVAGLCGQQFALLFPDSDAPASTDPLLVDVKSNEYLSALFYLILHDSSTRFRVEGSELLALAAKNTELTRPALEQCFDALDDDLLVVADTDNIVAMRRRQRRQLSCGRAAVQIILSRPMTRSRYALILNVVSLRSAHMTLLKYLRMTENGDTASVVDACRAIQLLARASDDFQREALVRHAAPTDALVGAQAAGSSTPLTRMGVAIREAIGDSLHQVLLHQAITEEEAFTILRAARSTSTGFGGNA